ncbi:MAG: hypothetical protein WD270_01350 [Acetobacterales bacterium]
MALAYAPARSALLDLGGRLVRVEKKVIGFLGSVAKAIRLARQMEVDYSRGRLDAQRLQQLVDDNR